MGALIGHGKGAAIGALVGGGDGTMAAYSIGKQNVILPPETSLHFSLATTGRDYQGRMNRPRSPLEGHWGNRVPKRQNSNRGEITIMNSETDERRRSDRLWLTLPLRFKGIDSNGQTVELEGRAISLSRHGARIQHPLLLDKGQAVRVKGPFGNHEAEFRVVKTIAPPGEKDGEYGIECADENENFWGIEFPTLDDNERADAKALLECRMCRSMALLPLTLTEVEALRSNGKVGKHCQNCTTETPWCYAEGRVPPSHVIEKAARNSMEGQSSWMTTIMGPIGRSHRRIIMQVPLGLRDSRGSAEVTRTENISKCGFCFTSDKRYLPGEIIMSVFPLDPVSRKTEMAARIVREQSIGGSGRKFYGATFEALSAPKPLVA